LKSPPLSAACVRSRRVRSSRCCSSRAPAEPC
jgi:hypothetical protein